MVKVAVLDYGIVNLRSAQKAFEISGAEARLTADKDLVLASDGVVLPGVGNFGKCAKALTDSGVRELALLAVENGIPFLGICYGMQMAIIEFARNKLKIKNAGSTELDKKCYPVVGLTLIHI